MNWIFASLLMFISSVGLYLSVRKSKELRTPQQLNNLAMFLVPGFVYLVLTIKTSTSLTLTPFEYALILVQSIFFSYFGNVFSLRAIELSPNPGYSLMISKSYVVFTALASVVVFSAPLGIKEVMAIMAIVLFSALIVIDKNRKKLSSSSSWFLLSVATFFCWGFLALSSKYLLILGVPILTRLLLSMMVVSVLIIGESIAKKVSWSNLSQAQLITLMLIGVFGSSFNFFMQVAYNMAPNVGFVNATNAASIAALTLLSSLFFKDEPSARKMVGVAGVLAGLVLLLV